MGNQVTTLGQIYPIEYFLADYCSDIVLDTNLGSTRFMKVAKVRHRDVGYCVAKVYAINDPSLPYQNHKARIEQIRQKLLLDGNLNSLPFIHCLINDRSIILLRQYVKYNLYDRLSTRPFLTSIEKRWIAYQILRSIQSIHKQSIYHGDIKSENILVTSFLWITLADFASYKPVTLPENNPSDFSYFFDTSRRHSCNMAPERFVESSIGSIDQNSETRQPNYNAQGELNDLNQLTPHMDLFSVGCVLAELFAEDTANGSLFDLGQILMFKKQQYEPSKMIEESISDPRVQRLVLNLTDIDPNKRNSATYHLEQLRPSLFPSYFQTLYTYIQRLISLTPDSKIFTLARDLDKILEEIITEDEHGLLLPLNLVSSTLRSLRTTEAKLTALKLCVRLVESSPTIMSEFTIDRLLPYIVHLLAKSESRVRALCIISLNNVLRHIDKLPASDSNVFVDYILPGLQPLAYDPSVLVRVALAANIGELAQMSRRFLDTTEKTFDLKLGLIQDAFSTIISQLLTDTNNNVRRAVLETSNVSKLCEFFGKEKTNEIILGHVITFLNDKNDFRLRASFFKSINCIASHLGPHYAQVLKPLMQQGLADSEEIVIFECLGAISAMTEQNLLTKELVYELFQEAVPLLSFPNKWIRNATVNFVIVLSKVAYSIDFNRRILPAIKLHLKRDIHGLRHESVLLDSLQNALPRCVIDSILNAADNKIDEIFNVVTRRKMLRNNRRYRGISETDARTFDEALTFDDGDEPPSKSELEILANVDRFSEDKLIDSELILRRINKNKRAAVIDRFEVIYNIDSNTVGLRQLQNDFNQAGIHQQMLFTGSQTMTAAHPSLANAASSTNLLKSQSASNLAALGARNSLQHQNQAHQPVTPATSANKFRGVLLAHLCEHKSAVNKLELIGKSSLFATCSNDATIKLWDCAGISTKPQILFRSRQTLIAPDAGAVTRIATCSGADSLIALTANNKLHMYSLNSGQGGASVQFVKSVNFSTQVSEPELLVNLVSLSPFSYATASASSNVKGYDLRLPTTSNVWNLTLDGKDGLITCMDGNEHCLACGTSSSVLALFDLRFYIRATSMSYPLFQERVRKRIRTVLLRDDEIYCSVDGNNEVSTWNCESGSRVKTLWASQAPCLSSTHSSHHSVLAMVVDSCKDTNSVITAGTDMKIRHWDLNNPHRSYLVSRPPANRHHKLSPAKQPQQQATRQATGVTCASRGGDTQLAADLRQQMVSYNTKLVDGIQVIQENDSTVAASADGGGGVGQLVAQNGASLPKGAVPELGADAQQAPTAHHDSIGCLATMPHLNLLLSASRDGVVKIWR